MKEDDKIPELSLLGGPLHWLGCKLRLVRGATNTLGLGVALGLSAVGDQLAARLFQMLTGF
jgi:hypothetical protein